MNDSPKALTTKEQREYQRLSKRWARRDPRLTMAQMLRCRALGRRDDATKRAAR